MHSQQLPLLHHHQDQPCWGWPRVPKDRPPAHAVKGWPVTGLLRRLENETGGFGKARIFWCHDATWRCPCSFQGGWTRWPWKVPSNLNYSTILSKPHFDCIAKFSEMSHIWAQEAKLRLSARMRGFLQFALVTNNMIIVWLRANVSSPTLGRYEVSEAKTDAFERSPLWQKLSVQPHFMKSHPL